MKRNEGISIYRKGKMNDKCRYFKKYKLHYGFGRCFSDEAKKNMGNSSMILSCEGCEYPATTIKY